jgi:histidine ammonia-lyase
MAQQPVIIDATCTSLDFFDKLILSGQPIALSQEAEKRISACRDYLDRKVGGTDALFYGINTGFGFLQDVRINADQLQELQNNLLKSHACGMGAEVPRPIVRLMLLLKIRSLCFGYSGVQLQTVQRLVDFYNEDVCPVVYTQGSLGASGDLAPLSHLCLPLIGLGEVVWKGVRMPADACLQKLGWRAVELQSKEGLALINGTQFMGAYGTYNLSKASRLIRWADLIAALSCDAYGCVEGPFHERIHAIRPHDGQIQTAAILRNILSGSPLYAQSKKQVQDPYSFRCIPQVHGASKDAYDFVQGVFLKEVNSVTDNPNLFPDEDLILSGGNFHGQPLALALDFLAIALSELASISERRTYQLISGQHGLPLFLVKNPGLHSGFMIPQYTAAGIVSENKQLCTPASVDSIPSSNNQEDHVSMGANAATKAKRVIDNVETVLAIELFTAAQALEFRRPEKTSPKLEWLMDAYRSRVSFNEADRILKQDMDATVQFLREFALTE